MFSFLFKRGDRSTRSSAAAKSEAAQKVIEQVALKASNQQTAENARQALLQQAAALKDEGAAITFITQTEFADARLQAAQLIQSPHGLKQVLQAMRNVDRRVTKLMQTRLDTLDREQKTAEQATLCLQKAQRLYEAPSLLPNQVADLDRAWQLIAHPAETQQQEFQQLREKLAQRLSTQATLQRSVLALIADMRQWNQQYKTEALAELPIEIQTVDSLAMQAQHAEAIMQGHMRNEEAISLPKNLHTDFATEIQALHQIIRNLKQQITQQLARQERHQQAAQKSAIELDAVASELPHDAQLESQLPSPAEESQEKVQKKVVKVAQVEDAAVKQQFLVALSGLETALEEGALQAAMDYDKSLRQLDFKVLKISAADNSRLTQARSELGRLQGWARWGGNVSREELMKSAQELPGLSLEISELAKKIGSLRARWKSLDVSAGPAPKVLWDGFDAACSAAYVPVAAHFQQMAQERQNNQTLALDEIAQVQQYADENMVENVTPNWKAIAQYCQQKQQAWRKIGTINRSEKKALDKAFSNALERLQTPLAEQQKTEIARRENLIAEVSALPVNQRETLEHLRQLQQRWQEQAQNLPLARQDEQKLWLRFREACDAIFAQRKEAASSADTERRQNLLGKEEVCSRLEAVLTAADLSENALAQSVRQAHQDWSKIGMVPRAAEAQITTRYNAAVTGVQTRIDFYRQQVLAAQKQALNDKLALCQAAEASLGLRTETAHDGETDRANWQALPVLPSAFEKAMRSRFDAVLKLHANGDTAAKSAYLSTLDNNRTALLHEILRAETMAGIDSPSSLSRERLQLQVEVLQASLKAGSAEVGSKQQLLTVASLPALIDAASHERMQRLILAINFQ